MTSAQRLRMQGLVKTLVGWKLLHAIWTHFKVIRFASLVFRKENIAASCAMLVCLFRWKNVFCWSWLLCGPWRQTGAMRHNVVCKLRPDVPLGHSIVIIHICIPIMSTWWNSNASKLPNRHNSYMYPNHEYLVEFQCLETPQTQWKHHVHIPHCSHTHTSSINLQVPTCHELAVLTRQECHHVRDILGASKST